MARPLTVLQLLPALESGGVERGTLEVAGHLVARGHRSLVVSAGGRLVAPLVAGGSEHVAWTIGRKRPGTLRYVPRLRRLLLAERVDVLHLRSRLPAWIGYLAWRGLPAARRPALVTTVHGPYTVGRYSAVMVRGERIIAVSQAIRDYILAHYPRVDPARIRVIHRGIDPRAFPYGHVPAAEWRDAWRAAHPALAERFVVTLPARLTRWKGQLPFVRVVAALRDAGVPVHGLIVGGHDARRAAFVDELRTEIRRCGLAERIDLLGHRDDLREILAVSDVVVSLSSEPEAFGRVTLEALGMGRPVAGYAHGGVAEQLAELLPEGAVAPGDVDGMAALLARWYRSPPTVTEGNPFTLQRMLDATLAVYCEVAG